MPLINFEQYVKQHGCSSSSRGWRPTIVTQSVFGSGSHRLRRSMENVGRIKFASGQHLEFSSARLGLSQFSPNIIMLHVVICGFVSVCVCFVLYMLRFAVTVCTRTPHARLWVSGYVFAWHLPALTENARGDLNNKQTTSNMHSLLTLMVSTFSFHTTHTTWGAISSWCIDFVQSGSAAWAEKGARKKEIPKIWDSKEKISQHLIAGWR